MQQDADKVGSETLLQELLTKEGPCSTAKEEKDEKKELLKKNQAEAAHTFNPSTWEAGRGKQISVSLRSAWSTEKISGQPELH